MSSILGLVLTVGLSLALASQGDQASPRDGAPGSQRDGNPAQSDKANPDARAGSKNDPKPEDVEAAVEHGVLVVRHGAKPSAGSPESEVAAETPHTAAPALRQPYHLYRVNIAEPWRYNAPRERSQDELRQLWRYRRTDNWKYHPTPRRSQAELEQLWKYRPTNP